MQLGRAFGVIRRAAVLVIASVVAGSCTPAAPSTSASTSPSAAATAPASPGQTVAASAALPEQPLPTRTASATDAALADAAAAAAFSNMDVPALYVGIWDPRRGFFEHAYGNAVRDGESATIGDSLRIASITKTFTATAILQLVEQGKIDLDTSATAYLAPPLAEDSKLAGITVEQLLGMQSGLADYLVNPNGIAAEIAANPKRAWKPEELVDAALALDSSPPGTGEYSNTNFVLLGLIAEHASGSSLNALIATSLTRPLGLTTTFLPDATDTSLPKPAAHGYLNEACVNKAVAGGAPDVDPQTDTTDWNTSYFYGAGGMVSTIDDLGAWSASDLGTALLGPATAARRLQVHDIGGEGFLYGLGIKQFGSYFGHDGDAFGWDSLALHNPTTGVSFVAAVNACTGYNDALLDLLQTLYPDQPTRSYAQTLRML